MTTDNNEKDISLTDQYKIKEKDEDSKQWAHLLDFESPIKVESDWYATETFQVFLDALDINQRTSLGNWKNVISNGSSSQAINTSNKSLDNNNDNHQATASSSSQLKDKTKAPLKSSTKKLDKTKQENFETILSAEALKILSELPDLSHMSATRSFIFPSAGTATSDKRINSDKR